MAPLNFRLAAPELIYILKDCASRVPGPARRNGGGDAGRLVFVRDFPRNPAGKILKKELKGKLS
jgi:hypothetical protein